MHDRITDTRVLDLWGRYLQNYQSKNKNTGIWL